MKIRFKKECSLRLGLLLVALAFSSIYWLASQANDDPTPAMVRFGSAGHGMPVSQETAEHLIREGYLLPNGEKKSDFTYYQPRSDLTTGELLQKIKEVLQAELDGTLD